MSAPEISDLMLKAAVDAAAKRRKGAALAMLEHLAASIRRGLLTQYEAETLLAVLDRAIARGEAEAAVFAGWPYMGRPEANAPRYEVYDAVEDWLFGERAAGRSPSKEQAYDAIAEARQFLRADQHNPQGTPLSRSQIKKICLETEKWLEEGDLDG